MKVENWGIISYQAALARQLELVDSREESLIVCTHPPVVTLGRGTKPGDVFGWSGETVEISRGGRATYHGPSQLVVYPILNLDQKRERLPARDLHAYMRVLEQAIILTLREFGIRAGTHDAMASTQLSVDKVLHGIEGSGDPSFTGVWVKVGDSNKKIASIGIGVKKWISYHGLALNISYDPQAHAGINPCGFQSEVMTSMEEVLGKPVSKSDVERILVSALISYLS